MAPTVKVWNLPKLRCNCSSDISCSPSLVWSHGRAAGSLPHPAPSPSIVLCSSVTLLWDQFTGVDWLPCPSSLRPIASCACAHPTSAWLILIAVIQSGNLLQPWGDVNDIAQTSGVQRNRAISANLWLWTFYWCSTAGRTDINTESWHLAGLPLKQELTVILFLFLKESQHHRQVCIFNIYQSEYWRIKLKV